MIRLISSIAAFGVISASAALAQNAASSGMSRPTSPGARDLLHADSIILERTPCFGRCPVYRLTLTSGGVVRRTSRAGHDTAGTLAPTVFRDLALHAMMLDLVALPDTIETVPHYCPVRPTDFATVVLSVFVKGWEKRIVDYQGCWWAPSGLRDLEQDVDQNAAAVIGRAGS